MALLTPWFQTSSLWYLVTVPEKWIQASRWHCPVERDGWGETSLLPKAQGDTPETNTTLSVNYMPIKINWLFFLRHNVLVAQSCPTLCDPMDWSLLGFSVYGILQARILEWVATPSSRDTSQPRDRTLVSFLTGIFFTVWATGTSPSPRRDYYGHRAHVGVYWKRLTLPRVERREGSDRETSRWGWHLKMVLKNLCLFTDGTVIFTGSWYCRWRYPCQCGYISDCNCHRIPLYIK